MLTRQYQISIKVGVVIYTYLLTWILHCFCRVKGLCQQFELFLGRMEHEGRDLLTRLHFQVYRKPTSHDDSS